MCLHKHGLVCRFPRIWKSMQSSQKLLLDCCTLISFRVGHTYPVKFGQCFKHPKPSMDQTCFFVTFLKATVLNCLNVECAEWDGPLHSHNMGGKPGQARRVPGAIQGDTCILACLSLYLTCSLWCSLSIVYSIFQISRYLPGLGDYKMINNGKMLPQTFFY